MQTIETERLILRQFREDDFASVHGYASCAENLIYMAWGPNNEKQTHDFIKKSILQADENPCRNYSYAVIIKEIGNLIGGCGVTPYGDDRAEIGWILHHDY